MPHTWQNRFLWPSLAGLGALAALLAGVGPAPAQRTYQERALEGFNPNRVDQLRDALSSTLPDRAERVKKAAAAIRSFSQLRRALALPQWQFGRGERAKLDLEVRQGLGKRFTDMVNAAVKDPDPRLRTAVATMIGEIGTSIAALQPGDLGGFMRSLAPQLVTLTRDDNAAVQAAAARALGKINADPAAAVPALRAVLQNGATEPRRAAAEGLLGLVRTVAQLQRKGQTQGGVESTAEDILNTGRLVVPAVGLGLTDADAQVRRICVQAVRRSALGLAEITPEPLNAEERARAPRYADIVRREMENAAPLVRELGKQGPVLARMLNDRDTRVQLLVRRALEDLGNAYRRLRNRQTGVTMRKVVRLPRGRGGLVLVAQREVTPLTPLLDGLTPAVEDLARGIDNPNPRERLAAVEFLEQMESSAVPAAPAVIRLLADCDLFIRWAAARTLRKMGPVLPEQAVPALASLVGDIDVDVRQAALATLAGYGAKGAQAMPALIKAVSVGDVEPRLAAMRTVLAVGKAGQEAVPALIAALTDPDARVRVAAAETLGSLGSIGPEARSAAAALRKALDDDDPNVRRAASEALLNILETPKK